MKQLVVIFISLTFFLGCDSATAPDCLKSRGETISKNYELEIFSEVEVNEDFNVIIKQGTEQSVRLITGKNLVENMMIEVNSGLLVLTDNNSCKWVRDLDFPTVEIVHPNLSVIRQNGGGKISSVGNLSYPQLLLESEGSSGDFNLNLTCENLSIVSNELSNFYLEGTVGELFVGFYAGDSRLEGRRLNVSNARFAHRGSNDMIVNIRNSLTGTLDGTGNFIYVGQTPQSIDVQENNRGRLIDGTGD